MFFHQSIAIYIFFFTFRHTLLYIQIQIRKIIHNVEDYLSLIQKYDIQFAIFSIAHHDNTREGHVMIVSAVDYYIASILDGHNAIIVDMISTVSMLLLLLLLVPAQCLHPALSGLKQVHVVARHGDRSPGPALYPADPYRSHHWNM